MLFFYSRTRLWYESVPSLDVALSLLRVLPVVVLGRGGVGAPHMDGAGRECTGKVIHMIRSEYEISRFNCFVT